MKFKKIEGLVAATFSPFDEQGELDLKIIPKYFNLLESNNIAGVFVCGTTGEGSSLTFIEKRELIQAWSKFQKDQFKVISMVSGTSQKEAIELAKVSADSGIYGISLTAPYYFKTSSVNQLVEFIGPIAEIAPEQAVYFYHIPLLSHVHLPMLDLLKQAGERIPNFAGIKYTHNDLMEFNQCLRFENGEYDILWGWDETFLAGFAMGAKGAVGSTYNFAAPLYHKLWTAFQNGDMSTALYYQEKSIEFISLYGKFGGAAAGKAIMKFCGLDCGSFRPPVKKLSSEELGDFLSLLNIQKFFENSIRS